MTLGVIHPTSSSPSRTKPKARFVPNNPLLPYVWSLVKSSRHLYLTALSLSKSLLVRRILHQGSTNTHLPWRKLLFLSYNYLLLASLTSYFRLTANCLCRRPNLTFSSYRRRLLQRPDGPPVPSYAFARPAGPAWLPAGGQPIQQPGTARIPPASSSTCRRPVWTSQPSFSA